MIDPHDFSELVIEPVLAGLEMDSAQARNLMMGTALAESGLVYLQQRGHGPALGVFQMEPNTALWLLDDYLGTRQALQDRFSAAVGGDTEISDNKRLAWDLGFQCALARVLYWTKPDPIPDSLEAQAAYWKQHYNTPAGAGTVGHYVQAVRAVFPDA